jgi:hypothetical protein
VEIWDWWKPLAKASKLRKLTWGALPITPVQGKLGRAKKTHAQGIEICGTSSKNKAPEFDSDGLWLLEGSLMTLRLASNHAKRKTDKEPVDISR